MEAKIDFVVLWVDGADPEWLREFGLWKERCTPQCDKEAHKINTRSTIDAAVERYREWDNMRYWFRAVECFAPWVNRVHFITWGHLPEWLDMSHPKLNVVKHTDFIPSEWLPTFSSPPIELNIHRIEGLAEKFVFFNDDMFLTAPVAPKRFFREGLPVDMARLNVIGGDHVEHISLECVKVVNRRHDKRKSIGRNLPKWFNIRYRASDIFKTMTLMPWSFFPGFKVHHMPQPFLRSTFDTLWNEEYETLAATSSHRFRRPDDVSQWLVRYEQIASGRFTPHGYRDTRLVKLSDDNIASVADMVRSRKYTMMCLNDNNDIQNFEMVKRRLNDAFEAILPGKSKFEK